MKTIITLLILFSSSYNFSQDLKLEISPYPTSLNEIMSQFATVRKEHIETDEGNRRIKISQKGGSYGYLKIWNNGAVEKSLHMHYVKGDRDKGNILIKHSGNDKKYGGFKVKTAGSSGNTTLAFSADGRYAIGIGMEDQDNLVYLSLFNIETRKLEVKEKPIKMDSNPRRLRMAGYAGAGNFVYTTDSYGWIQVMDIQSGTGKTYPIGEWVKNPKYLFASRVSNHFLVADDDKKVLVDANTGEPVYIEDGGGQSSVAFSIFVDTNGKVSPDISGQSLNKSGIGLIGVKNSVLVFDQDLNYYTLASEGADPVVLEYVTVNGHVLEAQPDPIPIVTDVLGLDELAVLYDQISRSTQGDFSEELLFAVFEAGEPYDTKLILKMAQSVNDGNKTLRRYFGKTLTEWVNNSELMVLTELGQPVNKGLYQWMKDYEKELSGFKKPYHERIKVAPEAAKAAKNKLQQAASDLYYMTVDELVAKGNQAVTSGANLSATAALLGVKFYEVAAMKEPDEPVHPLLIGNAYANANDYPKALEYYNKSLAMRPDYPLALFGILKTSFMPVHKGQVKLDHNLAKSIIANANRFLAVAPADYVPEMTTTKRYRAFCQLFLDDLGLYTAYNLMTGISDTKARTESVVGLLPKIEKTGNTFLAADMANIAAFDFVSLAESTNDKSYYLKAEAMFAKSVRGGVFDAQTYYKWAQINISQLSRNTEGLKIIEEAKKHYPLDANFDVLASNQYFNKGRELYLARSYSKAIPYFEKYLKSASDPVLKAHDYLGFSYYRTKNYANATAHLEKLKDGEKWNTLQAFYPNFTEVLTYAKNPNGVAPTVKDNGDKIVAMEEQYGKGLDMGGDAGLKLMIEAANYYDLINYDYGQGIAHSGVGVAYHRAGDKYSAKNHYKKCIDNGPQSSSCYNNLAMIYIDDKNLGDAKSVLDQGMAKFPKATDLKKTFAEYYIQKGFNDYEKKYYASAISHFKNSISNYDQDAWAHLYLGFSYYATGKRSSAKESLRKAVKLDAKLWNDYPAITQILNQ